MIPPKDIELEVLDGRLHIGAVPELRPLTGLNYLPLYDELSCLYCSSEHPLFAIPEQELDRKLLSQQAAVLPAYAQTVAVKEFMRDLKPAASSTDREGIAFLILTGQYIGYLPTHYAQRWVLEGRMRALLPEELNYSTAYAIITRKGARSNLVVKTFIEQFLKTSIHQK
jgi:DNA-binding transcriptional LysR family regulator